MTSRAMICKFETTPTCYSGDQSVKCPDGLAGPLHCEVPGASPECCQLMHAATDCDHDDACIEKAREESGLDLAHLQRECPALSPRSFQEAGEHCSAAWSSLLMPSQ